MPKDSVSRTAQVNLQMLANLGIPEAVRFRDALQLDGDPLAAIAHVPLAKRIPFCISTISEVLYQSANQLIMLENNPTIIDLACGYSPRVLLMAPQGFTYIGADLPDVTADLAAHRKDILPADAEIFAGYRTVDVTDRQQMDGVVGALREGLTVVTQGLLSYLSLGEKIDLATAIRGLLERDGGCWIIPDANPDTLLNDTFCAVLGETATSVVERIYGILDKKVGRNRSQASWRNPYEIERALTAMGFAVRKEPLYRFGMKLRCLNQTDVATAQRLIACWKQKTSLVVTLA